MLLIESLDNKGSTGGYLGYVRGEFACAPAVIDCVRRRQRIAHRQRSLHLRRIVIRHGGDPAALAEPGYDSTGHLCERFIAELIHHAISNATRDDLRTLGEMIDHSPYPKAEIQLTEWSSSPSPVDHSHDSLAAGDFVAKTTSKALLAILHNPA